MNTDEPMQTEEFLDLELEDGTIITAAERREAAKRALKERGRIAIKLPGNDNLISDFAKELVLELRKKNVLFFRQDSRQVVELGRIEDESGNEIETGFIPIRPSRFVTLIEDYFFPWTHSPTQGGGFKKVSRSMNKDVAGTVLESDIFHKGLPNIKRIFTVQAPILTKDTITFPEEGYDKRFQSWLPINAPKIEYPKMPLEVAKEVIYKVFSEFCFESRQDYINAIAALLTPFLRGIYKTGFNTRTPVFCYEANRERSGKDYLAGITGIIYEGHAMEEPPISNGEYRSSGGNDELRKKVIAAILNGRKRLHFSNNKGHLNNSVFESITTAERYSDRLLGKNDVVTLDNELEFSFSGNLGITLTPDLVNRTIFIRLFLEIEDANERKFSNPMLHKWILENRGMILSALYSLVTNWVEKGMPDGSLPFASFPEWARVCGGIMEAAGYNNPCYKDKEEGGISVDSETDEMKELFELCYSKNPDQFLSKNEIKELIEYSPTPIMPYIDFSNRSDQTKFALRLNKFVGRILSDIRLVVENKKIRSSRWKYKFSKAHEGISPEDIFKEQKKEEIA